MRILAPILAFIAGAAIAVYLVMRFQPAPPETDLRPYRDSIRVAELERTRWMEIAIDRKIRADSILHAAKSHTIQLSHDIDIVTYFTPDRRLRWHDSVMRAAGLR